MTFCQLATGWILATGRHTICGIIPYADPKGARSHDVFHRFFLHGAWEMRGLWQIWAQFLAKTFWPQGAIPLCVDDSVYHKSGRKVEGAGWWRDAVRSTKNKVVYAFGLNLVVITMRVDPPWGGEPLGIPIHVRLHRKGESNLLQLADAMMREILDWLPDRHFRLTGDGFYATMAGYELSRTYMTSRIRHDAAIYALKPKRSRKRGRPREKGRRLPIPSEMAKTIRNWKKLRVNIRGRTQERLIYTRKVLWYKVSKHPVLLVICRDPHGIQHDDFFFTTDIQADGAQVVSEYCGRWCIEDTFKNIKQILGGQQPQVWKGQAPERAAAFSFLLYGLVWTWYVCHGYRKTKIRILPWYPYKQNPAFIDAIASLRRALWRQRIFSTSTQRPVSAYNVKLLIDSLAAAA